MTRAVANVATWVQRPWLRARSLAASGSLVIGAALASLPFSWACGASSEPQSEPRYPEKRRPPPLRSASDGEILGADGVPMEDRLEASPTNQHPAAGWVMEDGKLVPEREARQRSQAHQRAGYPAGAQPASAPSGDKSDPDCDPGAAGATTPPGAGAAGSSSGRKPCPPQQKKLAPR